MPAPSFPQRLKERDPVQWRRLRAIPVLTLVHLIATIACSDPSGPVGTTDSTEPADSASYLRLTEIVAGEQHTCGLAEGGRAFCWGWNFYRQLGDGTDSVRLVPTPAGNHRRFQTLAAGSRHTCGVDVGGVAYCWGSNLDQQIGGGMYGPARADPTPVEGDQVFIDLTGSFSHTCGLTTAGRAFCWGRNFYGEVGDGSEMKRYVPAAVSGGHRFLAISAGSHHTCGLDMAGTAFCWGRNHMGQLGDGTVDTRLIPTQVAGEIRFTALESGNEHVCGLDESGSAYCWGRGDRGNLGTGQGTPGYMEVTPTPVVGDLSFQSLAVGGYHSCGLTAGSTLYCWGNNFRHQLGASSTGLCDDGYGRFHACSRLPLMVSGDHSFLEVEAGWQHTCGLRPDNVALCWGFNDYGQLGDSTRVSRLEPAPVVVGPPS